MNVSCPRCQIVIDCSGIPSGQPVQCPRCAQQFLSPGNPYQAPKETGFDFTPSVSTRSSSPRSYSRHESSWFGGAFGGTLGVIAALCVIPLLMCGGCVMLAGIGSTVQEKPTPAVKVIRKEVLKPKSPK